MDLTTQQRAALFWLVCIPLRFTLAKFGDAPWLRVFSGVIGTRWILGHENGDEGVFGGPSWWAEERPLHGIIHLTYALTGDPEWLKVDAYVGMVNWATSK